MSSGVNGLDLAVGRGDRAVLHAIVIHLAATGEHAGQIEIAGPESELGHRASRLGTDGEGELPRAHPHFGIPVAIQIVAAPRESGNVHHLVETSLGREHRAQHGTPQMRQIRSPEHSVPVRVVLLPSPEILARRAEAWIGGA
jgi:hypothetical protein